MKGKTDNTPMLLLTFLLFGVIIGLVIGLIVADLEGMDESEPSGSVVEQVDCSLSWNASTLICFTSDGVNVTINDRPANSGRINMSELPVGERYDQ